jgi:hypothetical protein
LGQEPNIKLGIEDLPRATPHPGPARRWAPDRPGDLGGPGDFPDDGFATPGPDTGYVYRLLRDRELPGGERHRTDVAVAVATAAAARASHHGRAPTKGDVDFAVDLVAGEGLDGLSGIEHDHERLRRWVASHHDRIAAS